MVDFDLEKELKNGLSFRDIFKSILTYSISLFLGFYWKDLLTEAINLYFPIGQNLREKFLIGVILTFVLVVFVWFMLKKKEGKKK